MSSSNRTAVPCEADLARADQSVGPLRLPMKNSLSFVKEFNRKYGRIGLSIQIRKDKLVDSLPNDEH